MSTVAKASITLVSISDAYAVSLAPSMCVIHADYDGSHPVLTNAYTLITVYCGEVKVPFTVEMVTASHISINYSLSKIDDCTYRLAITDLHYSLLEGGLDITVKPNDYTTLNGRFLFTVERESTMLDWIQAWESNKTTIGATSIITPKLFVGKKITGSYDTLAEVPGLTGVYIGPSENDSCGLYGYKNSIEIFHLDETGGKIGGWDLSQDGLYSSNGKLRILSDGSIRAVNDEFDTIWEVCADGSASFALGNAQFKANGDAEFKGKITSSEGNIAGWIITDSLLHCVPIALSATGKYIALANIDSYPLLEDGTWDEDHFNWVQRFGGVAMFHNSSTSFGLLVYKESVTPVFKAGSTNFIAGWNFDENAFWIGTKNNNSGQYTNGTTSLTIGTEGLRGYSWYINTNGTASFVKGLVTFGQTSGTIVGWTLTGTKIATSNIALTSAADTSGLYMTASADSDFVTIGPDAMEGFIVANGGIYLQVKSDSANFAAYSSSGNRLFEIQSNGANYIAGWCFNNTTLYTGTQVTSGFTNEGEITLGPTGLRGHKWRFENDGSGALAGDKINWDKDGNVRFVGSIAQPFECLKAEDFQTAPSGQYKVAPLKQVHNFLITSDSGTSVNPVLLLPCSINYNGITVNILFHPKVKTGSAVWVRPWRLDVDLPSDADYADVIPQYAGTLRVNGESISTSSQTTQYNYECDGFGLSDGYMVTLLAVPKDDWSECVWVMTNYINNIHLLSLID